MARRAVRFLCLAVVLVAALFHPDAAVEGKEEPLARLHRVVSSYCRCRTSEVTTLDVANSPVNKVPEISEIIGIAENFCKQVADDVLVIADDVKLVFEDEKWGCDAKCREKIKHELLEAMKHYNGLIDFIYCKRPSIQQLKEFICEESDAGDDYNQSQFETTIKNIGSMVKEVPSWFRTFWQKEMPTDPAKACKKLKQFPEVKFYMTF